jgi:hypothetical protein
MLFREKHEHFGKVRKRVKPIRNQLQNILLACEVAESNPLCGPKRYCRFTSYCDAIKAYYYISLNIQKPYQLKQMKQILLGLTGDSPLRHRQELSARKKQSKFLVLLTAQLFQTI